MIMSVVGQLRKDRVAAGVERHEPPAMDLVEVAQTGQRAVKDRDPRAHSRSDARGLGAHDSATDHQHAPRRHTRHAAHQDTAPPFFFCRAQAPICGASRPATSDIGASSGNPPSRPVTVS